MGFDSGKAAGALRVSPAGQRLPAGVPGDWPSADAGPGALVRLERSGPPHANDAMILARLALAVAVSRSRTGPGPGLHRAVERVLDGSAGGSGVARAVSGQPWNRPSAGTARAAAAGLALHHPTVQSRLAVAAAALGYDPRSGRAHAVRAGAYAATVAERPLALAR